MTDGELKQQEIQRAVDLATKFTEISGQLKNIDTKIETIINDMKSKHDDLSDKFDKAEKAIFDPKEGLYARTQALESWKTNANRILWIIVTCMCTATGAFVVDKLIR